MYAKIRKEKLWGESFDSTLMIGSSDCYPFLTLKTQSNNRFYFNRANVVTSTPVVVKARESYVPTVEEGEVHDLDPNKGIGHIEVTKKDGSKELVRFYYSVGICRAVVKDGRVTFEHDEQGREPHVGIKVRLIAGYLPGKDIPFTFHWCTIQSWTRAEEELKASPVQPEVPVVPNSHGAERKTRGKTGRPVSKMVTFPTGEEVTTTSGEQATA